MRFERVEWVSPDSTRNDPVIAFARLFWIRRGHGLFTHKAWNDFQGKASRHFAHATDTRAGRVRLLIRVGAGIVVVVILLLWRHWTYYGYVPLLQKPHQYAIDPALAGHG